MQFYKYLNMTKSQLQEEIDKTGAKIKNLKEQERLLKRLQESAREDPAKNDISQSVNQLNEV